MGGNPSKILDGPALWLGGENVLNDKTFFETNGITAVLSVCQSTPHQSISLKRKMHVDVYDMPHVKLTPHFWNCVQFIHEARMEGQNVYVHCAAGISRSTSMVCAYLMTHLGMSFDAALNHVVNCRPAACPNDGFRRQLNQYCKDARDGYLDELHSKFDSKQLLETDWTYVTSQTTNVDVESTQRKIFKALMKRKAEAGEHFGLEWLKQRMEAEGEGNDEPVSNDSTESTPVEL